MHSEEHIDTGENDPDMLFLFQINEGSWKTGAEEVCSYIWSACLPACMWIVTTVGLEVLGLMSEVLLLTWLLIMSLNQGSWATRLRRFAPLWLWYSISMPSILKGSLRGHTEPFELAIMELLLQAAKLSSSGGCSPQAQRFDMRHRESEFLSHEK